MFHPKNVGFGSDYLPTYLQASYIVYIPAIANLINKCLHKSMSWQFTSTLPQTKQYDIFRKEPFPRWNFICIKYT